jgi:uncharacterized protein with ParB-like and HNH nuclease domain
MTFQVPISIQDAISRIRQRRLLLPAIQREFVWNHTKVEWLFDSLLQDYPIGSFLFWEVRDTSAKKDYKYYDFLREYRERYQTENPEFSTAGHSDFEAVLDGQQRLTALYIGLTGSYAYYRGRVWWENTEYVLPTRHLYLNVLGKAPDDEDQAGRVYEFKFLTTEEHDAEPSKWFRVGRMLDTADAYKFMQMLKTEKYADNEFAMKALTKLHTVIHTERLINYYRIENSDMERALNVFIRVNSAEPLSLSDMLMSTAIAHWKEKDARKEIPGSVRQIRDKGFFIEKDFILKACLYLYSADIRYSVSNFTAARVKPFEENWDAIRASIESVFDLARDFGYNDTSLTSKNTLLPIIYWVHHKKLADSITTKVSLREQRDAIQRWLHVMLLKGIIGAGSADTVLSSIRKAMSPDEFGHPYLKLELEGFPVAAISAILKGQGKDPQITDEYIDSLLYTQKDARAAFTILSLLSPNLDYRNGDFHKDHLHPESAFKRRSLQKAGIRPEEIDFYSDANNYNSILNLAHLDANENKSKQDKNLEDWAAKEAKRQKVTMEQFCVARLLPEPALLSFPRFQQYIEARRKVLSDKLRAALA